MEKHVQPHSTLLKSSLVALISFQVLLSSWMQVQKNSSKERSWVKNMGWKSWQFSLAVDTGEKYVSQKYRLRQQLKGKPTPVGETSYCVFFNFIPTSYSAWDTILYYKTTPEVSTKTK